MSVRFQLLPVALSLGALAASGAAAHDEGRCATTRLRSEPQAFAAVIVIPVELPASLLPVVDRAQTLWNATCRPTHDVPEFVRGTELPYRIVEVRWEQAGDPALPGVCGTFVGNRVVLFGSARDEAGVERTCGGRERLAETLAHELGHSLGLEDRSEPECEEFIMSRLVRRSDGTLPERRVQPEECDAADRHSAPLGDAGTSVGAGR